MGGGRERGRNGISKGGRDIGRLLQREGGGGRKGEREGERRRLLQRKGGRNGGYYKGSIDGWKD